MGRPRRKPIQAKRSRGGQPGNANRLIHGRYGAKRIAHRKWVFNFLRRKTLIGYWLIAKLRELEGVPPLPHHEDRIAKTLESLKRYDPEIRARFHPPTGIG